MGKTRDGAEGRGLARAVRSDQRDDLAGVHGERHGAEGLHAPVEHVDLRDLEQRHG
jgi:hypothetical protein